MCQNQLYKNVRKTIQVNSVGQDAVRVQAGKFEERALPYRSLGMKASATPNINREISFLNKLKINRIEVSFE